MTLSSIYSTALTGVAATTTARSAATLTAASATAPSSTAATAMTSSATASTGLSAAAIKRAAALALGKAAHAFKSTTAQKQLEAKQATLTKDIRAAAAKAGLTLGATVSFSLSGNGALQTRGSDADKATLANLFKSDKSQPTLVSRVASMVSAADALSATLRQSAAISQASRYGAGSGSLMALYGTLLQQQDATPATYSLSAGASALDYPGALATSA